MMRSTAGRTTVIVVIVMLLAAWAAAAVLNRQIQNTVDTIVKQQLFPWLQQAVDEFSESGRDLADFFQREVPMGFTIVKAQWIDVLGRPTVLLEKVNDEDHSFAIPVTLDTTAGSIRLEIWSPQLVVLARLKNNVRWAMVFLAFIAGAAAYGASMWNVIPLRRLIRLGTRLTQGSFDQHFEVEGPREVEELSQVLEQVRLRFRQLVSGAITQAMIWEGQLELFPLSQLLMMLRFTSQTGVLVIMDTADLGRIYVRNGEIRGAAFKDQRGFRAFYAMFLLEQGAFKFNPRMKPFEDELQTASWYSTLLYAARRVHSLQFIEQYIPDQRFVARKTKLGLEAQQIQQDLTPDEWELFQIIDGEQNVRELARQLQWTVERVQRYLYRFAVVGLIETQFSIVTEQPPQNVVSLWARAAWHKRIGGM